MNAAGQINIYIRRRAGRVEDVEITSERPIGTSRLFEGKSPEEAMAQIPLLYSVCGVAQSTAAWRACRHALGEADSPLFGWAHELLVGCETLREHLIRVQLGWPELMGEEKVHDGLQIPGRLLSRAKQYLFVEGRPFDLDPSLQVGGDTLYSQFRILSGVLEESIFNIPPRDWAAMQDPEQLNDWIGKTETPAAAFLRFVRDKGESGLGRSDIKMLPPLHNDEINRVLSADVADSFLAYPRWHGDCCETTVVSRQQRHPLIQALIAIHGRGVMARAVARLMEIAQLPDRLIQLLQRIEIDPGSETEPERLPAGVGVGQVEAARGLLIHRVGLKNGKIARYQILAPTEWNFHPDGVLSRALRCLGEGDDATQRRQVATLVELIDPCVAWRLQLED